ncbi:otopetrin [Echinococcus multilocularis]|uniref:Otopetrin n=1 Tax=Echinococcus multilocularis TaxID=6211 RepID=A0A0S4MM46_ECHMU|nr:otopetrin [Echinococcus multilocularis]
MLKKRTDYQVFKSLPKEEMRTSSIDPRENNQSELDSDHVLNQSSSLDDKESPIMLHPSGINLYLRLRAIVFGFGVVIRNGLQVADWYNETGMPSDYHSDLWVPLNVIHSIYIFIQTYFLFKYHRLEQFGQEHLKEVELRKELRLYEKRSEGLNEIGQPTPEQ